MADLIQLQVDERGVERTLRKFKRMCDGLGVIREYRNRQEYKKPSVRHKEKLEASQKRRRKSEIKSRKFYKV